MKNTKFIALLLVLVMAAGVLAGCNSAKATTMVIGCIGPMTGDAATYGIAVRNGAQMAVDEINADGGVNGMKLELKYQDDEHNAEKSVNAYNTLKDQGMKMLVGTVTSQPCVAVAVKAAEDNLFLLTPSATSIDSIKGDNAFRMCFNDPNQGSASAKCIVDYKLAEKVGVIYNSSDTYSSGIYETFTARAKELGLEIVTAEAFTADSSTDFKAQLQKIKESGADLVFLPMYHKEAALIVKQAASEEMGLRFFGGDGLDGIIGTLEQDSALAEGVMLLTPFAADSTDETSQKFTNAYKAKYDGLVPTQFAADGYDCVYALKQALEKENVSDVNISVSELSDKMQKAFVDMTFEGVTGKITWSKDGEPTKDAKAMVIENGGYKAMNLE